MIKTTIKFNKKVKTLSTINFLNFGNSDTYDGVHYTNFGYTKIFQAINKLKFLNKWIFFSIKNDILDFQSYFLKQK